MSTARWPTAAPHREFDVVHDDQNTFDSLNRSSAMPATSSTALRDRPDVRHQLRPSHTRDSRWRVSAIQLVPPTQLLLSHLGWREGVEKLSGKRPLRSN